MSEAILPPKSTGKLSLKRARRPAVRSEKSLSGQQSRWLESFYRAHRNDLVGWLRRKFGLGPPLPEDIAQTAFIKLASMENRLSVQNPRSYLYTIAVNVARDEIRWLRRADEFVTRELSDLGYLSEELTPERLCADRQELELVVGAATGLSDKQREILERSRLLGQTYSQISAETGWSNADISRQLSDAILILKTAVERGRYGSPPKRKFVQ